MRSVKVYHIDAFSKEANQGNPAGVVLNGNDLSDEMMQEIALRVGFNETAFPIKSETADLRIRYFTLGHEINLCGHATLATIYALKSKGFLGGKSEMMIETKAGILPITISSDTNSDMYITMKDFTTVKEFTGLKKDLANSIGLSKEDIDENLPIVYGNTGTWTLLLPIKKLDAFKKMNPNNNLFPTILTELPKTSIHPFCLETYDAHADVHARHFSSPFSGTIEDAVTGTASGVMGAYYATYIRRNFQGTLNLVVEQGHEIEKDGRVMVRVSKKKDSYDIYITGTAVYVKDMEVVFNVCEGEANGFMRQN